MLPTDNKLINNKIENLLLKDEVFKVVGICMEVHKNLGKGFMEVVYQEAIEYEFIKAGIVYEREKKYPISYKDIILKKYFRADFLVFNELIVEIKAQNLNLDDFYKQVINYLAVSKKSIGLIVNFGEDSLKFKRVILTK